MSEQAAKPQTAPENLWRLVAVRADVPPRQRSGLAWDENDGAPDPYLKLVVSGEEVWESPTITDSTRPEFNVSPPKNLALSRTARLRLELWDEDGVSADPIGIYEGKALGDAIVGTNTTLKLEGGATVTVRVEAPEPHLGTGIALYELRKHALLLIKVVPNSPAARAGLKPGDRITAIGDKLIDELGTHKAESSLALAAQTQAELTVENAGKYRRVKLDDGYVWLSM